MRILITGGAGFIGSHLAELCLSKGHAVSIIDDLSTGSIENIAGMKANPKFEYVIDSIQDERLVAELVDSVDVVFHLAAAVGVRLIVEQPVQSIHTNVNGTEVILRVAAKKRKKVVIASTSEVYGKRNEVPFRESDDLVFGCSERSRWSYACSKALDEFLALAYLREKKVPTVIVRLFNTVGPRQTGRYGMVLPNFVRQAIAGDDVTVFGEGTQTRCFAHVSDIVSALLSLAKHPAAVGQIFNIGSQEEISILELAQRVIALTESSSRIVFVPYDQAYADGFEDMQRRVPDISKVHRLIGYAPKLSTDQIILSVVEYIRQPKIAAEEEAVSAGVR